jgi:hypothetical protein
MAPTALLASLLALVAPKTASPDKLASPTATTGGAAPEAAADTRGSAPKATDDALRQIWPRLGEAIDVTPAEQLKLDGIVASLRAGEQKAAQSAWKQLVSSRAAQGGDVDLNALVQHVLYESYLETSEDLRFYAEKVKFFNQAKKEIREHLKRVRAELAATKVGAASITIPTIVVCKRCLPGKKLVTPGKPKAFTGKQLEAYVAKLEARLNTIGDDAQLANVDLQNVLQKQQQTLQMMSNISKKLHDTAQAVIRKMGG